MKNAYNKLVFRILTTIGLALAILGQARADTTLIDVGSSPVVNVQVTTGTVTIRTWNRPQIAIDSQGPVNWQHYAPGAVAAKLPVQFSTLAQTVDTPKGRVTLAPEVWILPQLSTQPHDGVVLRGSGNTTITIPAGTAVVAARVSGGHVALQDYRGIFFTAVHTGEILLQNVVGTGFAQVVRGPIVALNSIFERFRGRTAVGSMLFENVAARQITISSVRGSIVYDNGSFQPGLARFESQYGNVILGVASGGAQIGAHSDTGHIMTDFFNPGDAAVQDDTPTAGLGAATDAHAVIGNGDATVTASTAHGTVLLFDGNLREHPALITHFPEVQQFYEQQTRQFLTLGQPQGAPKSLPVR